MQRVRQFPIEVAQVQFFLCQAARSPGIAPHAYGKQQALALL